MKKILAIVLIVLFASCADFLNPLIGTIWYMEEESYDIWTNSFDYEECYIEFIDGSKVKYWSGNNVIYGKYRFGDDVDWIYFEDFGNIDSAFWSTSTIDLYYTKDNGKRGTFVFYFLE